MWIFEIIENYFFLIFYNIPLDLVKYCDCLNGSGSRASVYCISSHTHTHSTNINRFLMKHRHWTPTFCRTIFALSGAIRVLSLRNKSWHKLFTRNMKICTQNINIFAAQNMHTNMDHAFLYRTRNPNYRRFSYISLTDIKSEYPSLCVTSTSGVTLIWFFFCFWFYFLLGFILFNRIHYAHIFLLVLRSAAGFWFWFFFLICPKCWPLILYMIFRLNTNLPTAAYLQRRCSFFH